MPLFMDYHKIPNVTIDDVKTAHMADVSTQDKYGVKYYQYWVNETEGSVFCLVEGPDAATCEMVHQMSHGNLACALTEVAPGFYEQLMGKDHQIDHGLVHNRDGSVDLGYRNIMVTSLYGITKATSSKDFSLLLTPQWARDIVIQTIETYKGRDLKWDTDDNLIGIFDDATQAVQCALQIQHALLQNSQIEPQVIFKIGISASQPVTADGDFFKDALKLAHHLCTTVTNNRILISSLVKKLCGKEQLLSDATRIKSLNCKEETFLLNLIRIAEAQLSDQQFDLNRLSNEVCVSRPQLYRKVMSLTGKSPHEFIHDLRLNKALLLLKQNKSSIAEIAYETGFNSPSYFTKCFTQKFGCAPSVLVKTTAA